MWPAIIRKIEKHHRFIISSHVSPDCDALGSALALAEHLRLLGKEVHILNTDPVIEDFQFLDPTHLIALYDPPIHMDILAQADVVFVLDASNWDRLGLVGDDLARLDVLSICIDHHPPEGPFVDLAYIDTDVVATSELIYDLIRAMDGKFTPLMATALYAATFTDSGGFRFPKTGPQTHRMVAHLIEAGANPAAIYSALYEREPLNRLHLRGYFLQHVELAGDGHIAFIAITTSILEQFQLESSQLYAFSNLPLQIKGVRASIVAVQQDSERVKLSFRSDGSVPVNVVARHFGGGGHLPAAGATVDGHPDEVLKKAVAELEKLIGN